MLIHRTPKFSDCELYFKWANDNEVRAHSFNSNQILYKNHKEWFENKISDPKCKLYLFEDQNKNPVGQVRIDIEKNDQATIGISIDAFYRGKGYGQIMLKNSCHEFHNSFPDICIHAYIKTDNITSFKIFEKANFVFIEKIIYNNSNSLHYVKYANR